MRRRHLLQAAAAMPGAIGHLTAQDRGSGERPAASADDIRRIDSAGTDLGGTATVPTFFTAAQSAALEQLCDAIAPATAAMPGAVAAGVPAFLDFLIGQSPAARQQMYRDGLDTLNVAGFGTANAREVDAALAPLRRAWKPGGEGQERFLRDAKDDILQATANSREWIAAASKRNRGARGLGTYWREIE